MTLQVSSLTYGQQLTIIAEFHKDKSLDELTTAFSQTRPVIQSAESATETRTSTNETIEALSIIIGRETWSITLP